MYKSIIFRFIAIILGICSVLPNICAQKDIRHRVIILTDIEADPDDTQSLIRLFLYANEIDIKGLVATTSCWLKTEVNPASIVRIINAYETVQPNLLKHEIGYPTAQYLSSLVKSGLPSYGMLGVGEHKNSEGSDWIVSELEKDDDRPLWISVWGGVNTLAQALYTLKETKSPEETARLVSKLRVYTISDQDDSGIWIRNTFPNLFYIVSPGDHYGSATWNAINTVVKGINNETISNNWFATHIQQDHGVLGALYPDVSWGVEGDTPAFLQLIQNGLNQAEYPNWGGWGGRYELYVPNFNEQKQGNSGVPYEAETRPIWTNAIDSFCPYKYSQYGRTVKKDTQTFISAKASLWRWRNDFQNDFAARMDWCVKSYEEANHPPIPILSHPDILEIKSGQSFQLEALKSYDPDGDNISFLWFPYLEAGTYTGDYSLGQPENAHRIYGKAPEVETEASIHIILKVTDKGSPALSRYKRIILNITP